jgi:hypothetical protein
MLGFRWREHYFEKKSSDLCINTVFFKLVSSCKKLSNNIETIEYFMIFTSDLPLHLIDIIGNNFTPLDFPPQAGGLRGVKSLKCLFPIMSNKSSVIRSTTLEAVLKVLVSGNAKCGLPLARE